MAISSGPRVMNRPRVRLGRVFSIGHRVGAGMIPSRTGSRLLAPGRCRPRAYSFDSGEPVLPGSLAEGGDILADQGLELLVGPDIGFDGRDLVGGNVFGAVASAFLSLEVAAWGPWGSRSPKRQMAP